MWKFLTKPWFRLGVLNIRGKGLFITSLHISVRQVAYELPIMFEAGAQDPFVSHQIWSWKDPFLNLWDAIGPILLTCCDLWILWILWALR